MARNRTATLADAEGNAPATGDFLSADDKVKLSEEGIAFHIIDVGYLAEAKFGAQWIFKFRLSDGTECKLGLSPNPRRDALAEGMLKTLKQYDEIGPLYLENVPLSGGNTTWTFSDKPSGNTLDKAMA